MNFLNPAIALAGLACVAIPIVIHLLMRRRRKPVQWAAMRFLMEAYRQQRRRLRLEQLLLLAARCMVIALVALALGRPFFGEASAFGGRSAMTLYLLIDNGLASSAHVGGTTALDRQKTAAANLLARLDPAAGDRAALVALGGPAQALVVPPTSDTGALRELIRTLEPTQSATDLPGGLSIIAGELGGERTGSRTVVAVLSDFLVGSADTDRVLSRIYGSGEGTRSSRDSVVLLASEPAERGVDNIAITAVEPLRPVIIAPRAGPQGGTGAQMPVRIALQRSGPRTSEAAVTTVRLSIESERSSGEPSSAGQTVVRWQPGQTEAVASVPLDVSRVPRPGPGTAGSSSMVLSATIDPDGIAGDNTWRRPVEVRRAIRVGVVAPRRLGMTGAGPQSLHQFESSEWVRLALSPMDDGLRASDDSEIEVTEIEPVTLDATRLAGLDAAVITRPDLISDPAWTRLRAFADAGGLVMVVPPAAAQVHLWPDVMTRELGLNWSIAREVREYPQRAQIAIDREGAGAAEVGTQPGLLALVRAELPELAPPVGILRILPVEATTTEGESQRATRGTAVLQLQDGTPLVLTSRAGVRESEGEDGDSRGLVILITTAFNFDWTDLHARPLMVPLLHELVRQGVGQAIGARVQRAGSYATLPARTVELRKASAPGEVGAEMIRADSTGSRSEQPLRRAGLWSALDERGVSRAVVAVNADPAGGRTNAQSPEAIREWLSAAVPGGEGWNVQWLEASQIVGAEQATAGTLHSIFDRRADDARLAIPLLIAALLFALLELGMARWFSHAVRPASLPTAPAIGPSRT